MVLMELMARRRAPGVSLKARNNDLGGEVVQYFHRKGWDKDKRSFPNLFAGTMTQDVVLAFQQGLSLIRYSALQTFVNKFSGNACSKKFWETHEDPKPDASCEKNGSR